MSGVTGVTQVGGGRAGPRRIVYYVSGHGFGHARRAAAIMRALVAADTAVEVIARTSAPAAIFAGVDRVRVEPPDIALDFGAAELDAMSIDVPATLAGVTALLKRRGEICRREVAYLRSAGAVMVAADVPFVAGDVVAAYRRDFGALPAVAVGNFTWDWIYEPYAARRPEFAGAIAEIRAAYGVFETYLRLPFSHDTALFTRVVETPLVVHDPETPPDAVARAIGVADDPRSRVLLAMRGGMADDVVSAAAAGSPHLLFLSLRPVAGLPANVRHVRGSVDFTDLMGACDVAVSKLGYGIVADAIACGDVRLMWPARQDFREDEVFRPTLGRVVREREISREAFGRGQWRETLDSLIADARPLERVRTDGAAVCAGEILRAIS